MNVAAEFAAGLRSLRSPFGAIEDWNLLVDFIKHKVGDVAVALRGDRGLELPQYQQDDTYVELRSPFGAIEDWNHDDYLPFLNPGVLRSPFGAIEDWNSDYLIPNGSYTWLRSPFGAIEDWNW